MSYNKSKKIALVNVFFPPHAIGGATRVIADQFDILVSKYAAQYDCTVFTTGDCINVKPYQIQVYPYKNTRVYKAAVALKPMTEWQYKDEKMKALFDLFLDHEQPDLIHIHCIQRMSAAILEAAIERNIPYIITIHDAWWISDFQFLVDRKGIQYLEGHPDPYKLPNLPDDISLDESLQRKYYLKSILNGAAQILSVSEKFADIYRKNGIPNILVNKNGISPINWLPKNTEHKNKVICAHIGGMEEHKGYFLFKECIEKINPCNIEVLVVDHSKEENYERLDRWKDVEVTFIGRMRQEQISALYSRIDVLFAPSKWPESFGLVTREAVASRCWVIASNLGAIGEDIITGENGFLVDVSTDRELSDMIMHIENHPKKFKAFSTVKKFERPLIK
ncbi:MAG: glycosyltransferase family 4 protein [Methylococcaceae bacterium]|nr:glycosyltransferase family 4 protein [Methylococcaceae bacterium]